MADLKAQLEQLEALLNQGLLSEENYRAALVGLGLERETELAEQTTREQRETRALESPAEPAITVGKLEGSGAIAQDRGVAAGAGGVAVGRDMYGDVIVIADPERLWLDIRHRPPAEELRRATESYLSHLMDRYRFLDFRGMGVSDRVPLRLPLVEMFVPLKVRIELPDWETWSRSLRRGGRQLTIEQDGAIARRLSEPKPVLNLLAESDGLILLGDPGAGKTTFLKYLTLRLAMGEGEDLGLGARLPVLLPLSAYAYALAAQGDIPLDRFIATYYRGRGVDLPIGPMLKEALEQGGALLLLDGLDEVKDLAQRHLVVQRVVDFFTFERQRGNKFVLTSRIVGYRDVRPEVEGLVEGTLMDFEEDDITQFVDRWTAALEQAARGVSPVADREAARERDELLEAVRCKPGVRRLASNPLLLTILALMKRQGVTLPERRVELYQKYVETLLKHWNLVRGLDRPPSRDLDVVETVRLLAPLALWMHETSPGVGLVKREAMRRRLKEICAKRGLPEPDRAAQRLLEDVREHAGLLLERGPGEFGFIHLTFQEYLAAVAIALLAQWDTRPVVRALAARVGDDNWHEVTLLTIGYMGIVQQRDEAASDVLWRLISLSPGKAGRAVVVAGQAVVDVWPGGVTPQCKDRVVQALVLTLMADRHVAPRLRAAAGDTLARLGDPRREALTLDHMEFCWVPAGWFLMGSPDSDRLATPVEKPSHRVEIPYDYWLARHPVTRAQFQAYVEASGNGPGGMEVSRGLGNHPVVQVSWHEARAFCAWLTETWRKKGALSKAWEVRLPSEAEWEKGARGGLKIPEAPVVVSATEFLAQKRGRSRTPDLVPNPSPRRLYPWGDDPDMNRANYSDTNIAGTSPVGCFPSGASPYGCLDVSGNVWEWTLSLWGEDFRKPSFRYPYDAADGREDAEAADGCHRVLRAGAFIELHSNIRCAYRLGLFPNVRADYVGFRPIIAPCV